MLHHPELSPDGERKMGDEQGEHMPHSQIARHRRHWFGVSLTLLILVILWLTGYLKPAPGLIAPGSNFSSHNQQHAVSPLPARMG
jgi:hypothetical protein